MSSTDVRGCMWYGVGPDHEGTRPGPPEAFIQWKGTDVCLDFTCLCGEGGHFDGDFAYALKCRCGRVFATPSVVPLVEVGPELGYWYDNAREIDYE